MGSETTASTNGQPRSSADLPDEVAALQARCRRQATELDGLGHAMTALQRGAKALKAENAELRAENERLSGHRRFAASSGRGRQGGLVDLAIPLGVQAPGIARAAVADRLAERVTPAVLETTLLLVSELVTNSVLHSGVPEGEDIVVRVDVWRDTCRLEVEDRGRDGIVAPRAAEAGSGAGMGLNLVAMLSERWGVVRAVEGPTRVWAQLPCGAPV
jgi:anti-sigma regulatory factor (Ser/Thr protein kinase)